MANSWWKRCLVGVAGGAAGTAAMDFYMKAVKKASSLQQSSSRQQSHSRPMVHHVSLIGRHHQPGEPATAAIGRLAFRKVTGRDPDDETRNKLSNLVHWGYGIDMGATYALLRDRQPHLDWAGGLAFGAALWVLGDEIAVPLLGLGEGPKAYPKSLHAETLGAHLVYGVTTAATTQLLERVVS